MSVVETLPGFDGLFEVIGTPAGSYERPDDPALPFVLFSGDETLHLIGLIQCHRAGAPPIHAAPLRRAEADPGCPLCASIFAKVEALQQAAAPHQPSTDAEEEK